MKNLTWRELKAEIDKMTDEHLDDNISVYDSYEHEYRSVEAISIADGTTENGEDVLDNGQLILKI